MRESCTQNFSKKKYNLKKLLVTQHIYAFDKTKSLKQLHFIEQAFQCDFRNYKS